MKTFSKILAGIIIVLIIIVVALAIIFNSLVNTGKIKQFVIKQVYEKTGRTLVIQQLKWSMFPTAHISLEGVSLSNPKSFDQQNFLTLNHANVGVKLFPFIRGDVETTDIKVDGLTLNLIENKQGKTNWQDLLSKAKTSKPGNTVTKISTGSETSSINTSHQGNLIIPAVNINNVNLSYTNQKTGQTIKLSNINVNATNIRNKQAFPISASVNYQQSNPLLVTKATLNGQLKFDRNSIQIINTDFSGSIKNDNGTKKIALSEINATVTSEHNNIININPVSANLYGGTLAGRAVINLVNQPQYQLSFKLNNIAIKNLLDNLYQYDQFTGTTNLSMDLNTQGSAKNQLLENLNGKGQFNIKDGQFQGVDISYIARQALSLINKKVKTVQNQHVTQFGHLLGQFTIQNGVIHNNIDLVSPVLNVTGKGFTNLISTKIKYDCVGTLMQGSLADPKPMKPDIPFKIRGDFKHQKFEPDLGAITQSVVKNQLQKQLKGQLKKLKIGGDMGKQLQGLLGGL